MIPFARLDERRFADKGADDGVKLYGIPLRLLLNLYEMGIYEDELYNKKSYPVRIAFNNSFISILHFPVNFQAMPVGIFLSQLCQFGEQHGKLPGMAIMNFLRQLICIFPISTLIV